MCTMFLASLQAKYKYDFTLLYAFTMGVDWVAAMLTCAMLEGCGLIK